MTNEDAKAAETPTRVVVAEDEVLIRLDLVEMLTEEGYEVVGQAGEYVHVVVGDGGGRATLGEGVWLVEVRELLGDALARHSLRSLGRHSRLRVSLFLSVRWMEERVSGGREREMN